MKETQPQPPPAFQLPLRRIAFLPELDAYGGYGLHAAQYVKHWLAAGIFVTVRPTKILESEDASIPMEVNRHFVHCDQPEPWELILSPAHFRPSCRRKVVFFSMYESSRFTPRQVKEFNRCAAVIVPCEWNRVGLRESGCIVPIHVVPLGYDDEVFKLSPVLASGPCVFGAAGRMSHGAIRKGLNVVINAFTSEFKHEKDVELHIKGFEDHPTEFCIDPRVKVRNGFLSSETMADWYRGLTAFVSASRGEAWGLMQLEAMASGRPVVASIYGGLEEFMDPLSSYPVDFFETKSEEAWSNGGNWASPDEKHLRHLMRRIYKDRAEAQRKGLVASRSVQDLTWKNSALATVKVLEEIGFFGS